MKEQKKAYSEPKVTAHGTLQQITQGLSTGTRVDKLTQVGQVATFLS